MHLFAKCWLLLFVLIAPACALAQAPDGTVGTDTAYAFCTVTDTGSVPAKVWASPVFAFSYRHDDSGAFQRSNTMASEFLSHVGGLGGAGTKACMVDPQQGAVLALREQQRAIWSKRFLLMKAGSWHEVDWTPTALDTAAVAPAQAVRYFYCYATQVDIPDRSDRARTVASQIFVMPVGGDPMAVYRQSSAYAEAFKQVVRAHGVADDATLCTAYDTQGEADKASRDYRKLLGGFNTKFTEVAWQPSLSAAAETPPPAAATGMTPGSPKLLGVRIVPVTPELALAAGLPSLQGAWVLEVFEGSVATQAGIKPMDVLLEIGGQPIARSDELPRSVASIPVGVPTPVQLWRDRRRQQVSVIFPADAATPVPASGAPR